MHRKSKLKLFNLIDDDDGSALESILAESACMHDQFALNFFATYNTITKLRSHECRIVLLSAAIIAALLGTKEHLSYMA